ncbi:MAG: TatD family hydrolase [Treponema sp.]|jgi:TatD DNase family protein|nr:TatD family hydrolase [Treponema sp.]
MCTYQQNFYDNPGLIDTHAHLSMLKPITETASVKADLSQLFASGFQGIIDIGVEAGDLRRRIKDFAEYPEVWFTAGIWPASQAIAEQKALFPILEQHIAEAPKNRLVAIGECGLDRHHNKTADIGRERELFELQLNLAKQLNLPIIVHSREAPQETRAVLANYPEVQGVIHCFSYGVSEARDFLDLGYYLSFAGVLTYKSAQALREAFTFTPLDKMLLETDAPFLAPTPFRGKPAHPYMIAETYKRAAALRAVNLEALKEQIAQNVRTLFTAMRA